jgi:hypothetical protein
MRFTLPRRKRPSERFPIGVDLTNELEVGDTLVTHTITAWDGVTDVTLTLLEAPTLGPAISSATLKNGVDGKTYRVNFVVNTAAGNEYEHDILISVTTLA